MSLPQISRPRLRRSAAFSLPELLVVVAVMTLMTGLLAPAFTSLGRASSLVSGGNLLSNNLSLARQNAMTRGSLTALVMLTEGEDSHRAFSLFELSPKADGSTLQSQDWKQISRWEKLPVGIVADEAPFDGFPGNVSPALPSMTYAGTPVSDFKYLVFQSNGGLYQATQPARVQLVEGTWRGGNLEARKKNGEAVNFYELYVLPASGRTKLNRP